MRPSLSSMISANAEEAKYRTDEENFASFANVCRFPLNVAKTMQTYIYFLKCLDPTDIKCSTSPWLDIAVRCPILRGNIEKTNVVKVDSKTILEVLHSARNIGEAPVSLKQFRGACIDPFVTRQDARVALTWTVVLRLYLGAFQRQSVRDACWRGLVAGMPALKWDKSCTSETLASVNAFVAREVFDSDNCLRMLEASVRALESKRC